MTQSARQQAKEPAWISPGYHMWIDPAVPEQASVLTNGGYYEYPAIVVMLRLLGRKGTLLDIGANIGFYSCAVASRGDGFEGRIFAFEPVPANFERLNRNVVLNKLEDRVETARMALGPEAGELELWVLPEGESNNAVGANVMKDYDQENVKKQGWRQAHAPMMTLDGWAAEKGLEQCDVIKIDVEGADLDVCVGGSTTIDRHRPFIFAEFNPYWFGQMGHTMQDVAAFFGGRNYRMLKEIGSRFEPVALDDRHRGEDMPCYLLVPEEKMGTVEAAQSL